MRLGPESGEKRRVVGRDRHRGWDALLRPLPSDRLAWRRLSAPPAFKYHAHRHAFSRAPLQGVALSCGGGARATSSDVWVKEPAR